MPARNTDEDPAEETEEDFVGAAHFSFNVCMKDRLRAMRHAGVCALL